MIQFGAMERVLGGPRDQLFSTAKRAGVAGVELEIHHDAVAVKRQAAEAGVRVLSVICSGSGLGAANLAERLLASERLRRALENAAFLEADAVLLPHFSPTVATDPAERKRFLEDICTRLEEAAHLQVILAWENALDAAETRELLDEVCSPWFRCCFDFANAAKRGADPAAEIRSLRELVFRVHAKNVDKQPLDVPGVDLPACIAALREIGYDGWIVLETPPGDDPAASAAHNLRVLQRTIAR
jgi:sugar phosphate isomerase/epimerase